MRKFTTTRLTSMKTLTIMFFTMIGFSAAAQNAQLKGVVKTSDGHPAAFVNIQLKEVKKSTMTGEDGSYTISNLKEGNYNIIVSFVGLQSITRNVDLKEGEINNIDFILSENSNQLTEVVVTYNKGINEKALTTGKVGIKPMDLPQSIAVIGKDIMERQQVLQLSDALQNVTGVYVMGTTGGYQEEIAGRGYAFSSSNTFKNGSRYNNGIIPELSSVEKLEFLKGGSAILYGNVAAGGVLNIITKKPKFESGGEVSFRTGSYDFYKPTIDVYGAINKSKTVAYRVNSSYQKAGSFRDNVRSERFYVNPSLLFKLGKKTELLVEGDYLKDKRTPDFGIGAINYAIADVPRSRFLGVNWAYNDAQQISTTATLTHDLNSNWQIKGMLSVQDYETELFTAARPSAVQANGNLIRGLQKSRTEENYYIGQVDLTGKFTTGKIKHTFLFGADADKYKTAVYTYIANRFNSGSSNAAIRNQNIYDTINIYNTATFNLRQDIPFLATDRITTSPIERVGVYIQDLISVTDKLKVLAGVRYTYQNNKQATVDTVSKGSNKGFVAAYTNDAFSPRLGIVYQPLRTVSVFASYTNTFTVNTGVDINNQALVPSIIDQYEVGVKTDLLKGLLSVNVTAYQIINSNLAQTALTLADGSPNTNTNIRELAGEVTSKGIELDVATKPVNGFSVLAGYSYNDTKYTGGNGKNFNTGDRLRYNPNHTANASVFYAFDERSSLKGFSAGLGAYYVGNRLAGRNPSTTNPNYKLIALPDYTLFDASVGYTIEKLSFRVKMTNLSDKLTYNAHDDNSINPIAPRQFAATIGYKF